MSAVQIVMMLALTSHLDTSEVEIPPVETPPVQQVGLASWYGDGAMHGEVTANGEVFDPSSFTCAHRSLPFGTMVLVVNKANDRKVWCRINDRGPYGASLPDGSWTLRLSSRDEGSWRGIIDLSYASAQALGTTEVGLQRVELRYWARQAPQVHLAAIDRQYP